MPTVSRRFCSVVIPTRNEGAMLHMTVDSILSRTIYPSYEVVIVDDGSTDGSCDRFREGPVAHVRVVEGGGLGVAGARNRGAEAARGSFLVFIDGHCTVEPLWLDRLVESLGPLDVGVVGPAFSRLHEPEPRGCGLTWADWRLDICWFAPQEVEEPYEVPLTTGACQAVRASNFQRLGRYEPGFTTWGYEDIELCLRAWALGYRVVVDPRTTVAHHFRESRGYDVVDAHVVYNFLRMIHLHFSPPRIERVVEAIGPQEGLVEAAAMLAASDTAQLRAALDAVRVRDDDWFFHRFMPGLRLEGEAVLS